MKKPGTSFTWKDLSGYTSSTVEESVPRPLLLTSSSFDKGPEDMMTVYGEKFYKLFGNDISFARHGQPAVQAANAIDAGAELLIKRIVADDATLANMVVVAALTKVQTPKVDQKTGNPVYIDKDTQQETDKAQSDGGEANERAMINTCSIKYDLASIENAQTIDDVAEKAKELVDEGKTDPNTFKYPLFIVTDNGRGVSSKRVNFNIDYSISKNTKFAMYTLTYLGEVGFDYEYARFSANPDTIYLGKSYSLSLTSKDLLQVKAAVTDSYSAFHAKVAEFSGIEEDELDSIDILFGCDFRGKKIAQITIDDTGYDLAADYGLPLLSGSNGAFGDAPFGTDEYKTKTVEFYNGTSDPVIYDRDRYKIAACIDANYPVEVKQAITELVKYREDFVFLRDLGLDNNSYDAIIIAADSLPETKFAANYCQSYDVIDKFTKRQINVTIGYSLARLIVNHLNNYTNAPFAGLLYNITIPEAIEGTINFIPMETPKVDQKTLLMDNRLNYASYVNNVFTVELQLTSQERDTQCTHINNILAAQDLMRDIRTTCPQNRYSFIYQTEGLKRYADDVQAVIDRHKSNFKSCEFEWTADEVQLANKIFNATVYLSFYDYVQAEDFVICTIN